MRQRLFLVSLALIAAGLVVSELLLVPRYEREGIERTRSELVHLARAAREARNAAGSDPASAPEVARRFAAAVGVGISYIAQDGQILGDGAPPGAGPRTLTASVEEAELAQALAGQVGSASRIDAADGRRYLYVALPPDGDPAAVTRVALPLGQVEQGVARVRRLMLIVAGIGVLTAALLSSFAARLVSRPLDAMTQAAESLRARRFDRRLRPSSNDDLGRLGRALDGLAEDLEGTLGALTRERDLLGAVLEGMADGVLVTDASARIVRSNTALRALLPQDRVEPGRTLLEATRHPELLEHVRQVLDLRRPRRDEIEIAGPPARSFRVSSAPVPDPPGVVTVFHEITEIRRLERVRRDFVANVSHELRTPVAALQAAGETLLGGALEDPERAREFLAIIARNAERLGALVSDLLALARLESGELHLAPERLALGLSVATISEAMAERLAAKRLGLSTDIDPGLSVVADPRALAQILTNLLDNAIKYTPDGGSIGVEATPLERSVRIGVWDTGAGLEPQHRPRVFERFYRVDKGRSRELGGTGLGLAIVKHMAEAMGGTVGVEPNPGGGSRFWLELPRRSSVLFACVHNAGRSPMAAALFNLAADPAAAQAISAGTAPAERLHPAVIDAMREIGVELGGQRPRRLSEALSGSADLVVTLGCGESCPLLPGVERVDWPIPDPAGEPLPAVRAIRDELQARVGALVRERGWARSERK